MCYCYLRQLSVQILDGQVPVGQIASDIVVYQ